MIETLVVGFVSGVITGILLLAGAWVFILPKIPALLRAEESGRPPLSWVESVLRAILRHYKRRAGR